VILAFMAYVFTVAFLAHSPAEFSAIPQDAAAGWTPVAALDVVIATAISWTVLSAEFNRLARTQRAGIIGSGIGYTLSTVLAMTLGATAIGYVVLDGGEAVPFDPTVIVAAFGAPVAVVIFLSVMATNTMVVYGMVASVVNMTPSRRITFLPTAIVLGAVSILGSTWLALLDRFTSFLTVIGALFIPVFAIMIVDYYLVRSRHYGRDILQARGGEYWYTGGVNVAAVLVWLVGAGASLLLTYVVPSPIGATIPTFVLSALLYLGWAAATRRIDRTRRPHVHLLQLPEPRPTHADH
jgi:NCS1 family nucleobase:cation symporter-1